jgi:hypothetical protein
MLDEKNDEDKITENLNNVQVHKDEPWFSDLCQLLEKGYCTPEKAHIYAIHEACGKIGFTTGYRNFFGRHYIIHCNEMDRYLLKRQGCLLYFLEQTKAELKEYSDNHSWDAPKLGFLKEWEAAAFRFERVKQMIDEIPAHHTGFEDIVKVYVGTMSGYSCRMTHTSDPRPYIDRIDFSVRFTNNMYSGLEDKLAFRVDDNISTNWLISGLYDEEYHKRYDEGKGTDLRAYVDTINVIRKFEWVEE